MPASSKPTTSGAPKGTPLGANKYPGTNQVGGMKKAITNGANTTRSTAGSVTGGAKKSIGGVTGGVVGGSQKALVSNSSPFKPTQSKSQNQPKSNQNSNSLPKPNPPNSFNQPDKPKTAVRPGKPKPFTAPVEQNKATNTGKKTYPGTNTIPGQGSKVPVQNQRLKPLPRLGPQVGQGKEMVHLAV